MPLWEDNSVHVAADNAVPTEFAVLFQAEYAKGLSATPQSCSASKETRFSVMLSTMKVR